MKNLSTMGFTSLDQLVSSTNQRAEQANITNAKHLMGDASDDDDFGDAEDENGDVDYGDVDYGDPSPLGVYEVLMGDVRSSRNKKIAASIGGLAGGAALGIGLNKILKRRAANKAATNSKMRRVGSRLTISGQNRARTSMGKIRRDAQIPFFEVTGATLNASPIATSETFVCDMLKSVFDRQQMDTPFEIEIVPGTYSGSTWTVTASGTTAARYYAIAIITIGINQLSANPGSIFSITGTMPVNNGGSLVIASNPFSFTLGNAFLARFSIMPWQIVTNKPMFAMGSYSASNPISFSITGIPANANVNLTIPGSQTVWTRTFRSRLL
jgi:hypothetical protein